MIVTIEIPDMDETTMSVIKSVIEPVAQALAEAMAPAIKCLTDKIDKLESDFEVANQARITTERENVEKTTEIVYLRKEILDLTAQRDKALTEVSEWEAEVHRTDDDHKRAMAGLETLRETACHDRDHYKALYDSSQNTLKSVTARNLDLIQRAHDMVSMIEGWKLG